MEDLKKQYGPLGAPIQGKEEVIKTLKRIIVIIYHEQVEQWKASAL